MAVDLSEPMGLIESLTSRLDLADADIGALLNYLGALSNSFRAAGQIITTLQEFDLVFL